MVPGFPAMMSPFDDDDDSFVCPSCGRVTVQTITCPTCHNECCIENCAPAGVGVECLACEEQRVFDEEQDADEYDKLMSRMG